MANLLIVSAILAGAVYYADDTDAFSRRVPSDAQVVVLPGDSVADIVKDSDEGTVFIFEPGLYRGQSIVPKDNQKFIAKGKAILSGAIVLNEWKRQGKYWVAEGLPRPLRPHGECIEGYETCIHREDLFVDDRPLRRVSALESVGRGSWYYEGGRAFVTDDPRGAKVELSVLPFAFNGKAKGITIENLIVEKYASQAQSGAIHGRYGKKWIVKNVTARWNHGLGLFIGDDMQVLGGAYNNNGQMGMAGKGDNALIDGVQIAYNNYAKFEYDWEAGGFKFDNSRGIVVRNSCVHHNDGVGMWNDIDNVDTLFENNKSFENARVGISQEISYAAVIRNNIVARNGSQRDGWLWGSQILVLNSQNVEVYGNVVEIAPNFGNGITIIHQDRGSGRYGQYDTKNNHIHSNKVIHLGKYGRNGWITDFDYEWFEKEANNRFDRNAYVVPSADIKAWAIHDRWRTWEYAREHGMEANGTLVVERAEPMALSCDS